MSMQILLIGLLGLIQGIETNPDQKIFLYIVLLSLLGLLFVFLEIFIPGGVVGALGTLMMVIAVWLCFEQYGPQEGFLILFLSITSTILVIIYALKRLPHTTVGQWIILGESNSKEKGYHSDMFAHSGLEGKEGVTESTLRPAGIALINNERIDVVTEGEYLEPHCRIRVTRVESNRVIVERI